MNRRENTPVSQSERKGFFVDRDGVLNRAIVRGNVVSSPHSLREFEILEGSDTMMQKARAKGYVLVVVTNQPDVSRGLLEPEELKKMHEVLRNKIPLDAIEVCTSGDDSNYRRKPNPGMIVEAAQRLGIRLRDSFIVGDGAKDIEAGLRAGVKTVLLKREYNSSLPLKADFVCDTYDEIIKLL